MPDSEMVGLSPSLAAPQKPEESSVNDATSAAGRFLLHIVLFVLAFAPAVGPLLLIHKYAVNVPYWDEWSIADAMIDAHHHVFPASLFDQHNEHRIVVPRIIYCALDNATGWNQIADMLAEFSVVCLTSLGILALIRSTVRHSSDRPFSVYPLWFICNVLIFSIGQQENWLWAIGMMNVLPMAFIVAAMVVFRSRWGPWTRMIGCLLMGTAATFSSGNGMLVWPLVGLLWAWSPSFSALLEKRNLLIAWTIGGAINLGLYFLHFFIPRDAAGYTNDIHKISFYAQVFLGNLFNSGGTLQQVAVIGIALVALLLLCALTLFWRSWVGRDFPLSSDGLPWLMVAGFAILSAVMAGHGRGGESAIQATAPRYITFALYLPVAVLCLSVIVTSGSKGQSRIGLVLTGVLSGAMLVLLLQCVEPTLTIVSSSQELRKQAKGTLLLVNSLPDDDSQLLYLYPNAAFLRRQAKRTNEIGLIHPPLIADNHANKILNTDKGYLVSGSIDTAETYEKTSFHAGGWAVLPRKNSVADSVFLTWDHNDNDPVIFAVADEGLDRADVAGALKNEQYAKSGWNLVCPLNRLPADLQPLRIRAWVLDLDTAKATQVPGEIQYRR